MPSALESATLFALQVGTAAIVLVVIIAVIVCLGALATFSVIWLRHSLEERMEAMKSPAVRSDEYLERMTK